MVDDKKRCVIIAASPDLDGKFLCDNISENDFIICADGGLDRSTSVGIVPDLVVGDFDSLVHKESLKYTQNVTLKVEKDDTDTMHCAVEAVERGFKKIVMLGATGGRLDHTLANLSVLLFLQKNGAEGKIIDRYNEVMLLKQGSNVLNNIKSCTVSVMPFACFQAVLSYKGMYYPMNNQTVSVVYPYTISNIAEQDSVEIVLHSGTALVFIVYTENEHFLK